jgi:DNA-binding MarR family transcriptional regulator
VPNPGDRRGVLAELTPSGRRVAEEATIVLNKEVFAELGLAPDERAALYRLLKKLRHQAGDFV